MAGSIAVVLDLVDPSRAHRRFRNASGDARLNVTVESDFEIFKIQHFNAYKKFVKANFVVAAALVVLLTVIAYLAATEVAVEVTIGIVALSILPAPATLGILWYDASNSSKPIRERAARLEERALAAARS
jgi:uncharacterized membrane protein